MIKFTVYGEAVPKQSFRMGKFGGYQSKRVTDYANLIKLTFMQQYPEHNPAIFDNSALKVVIREYRAVPSSKSKKFKMRALAGEIRPITRPDTDNISKGIKDALNGIVYPDDKQIVTEHIEKWYSDTPRVEIEIERI